jgi:hypothetical protein
MAFAQRKTGGTNYNGQWNLIAVDIPGEFYYSPQTDSLKLYQQFKNRIGFDKKGLADQQETLTALKTKLKSNVGAAWLRFNGDSVTCYNGNSSVTARFTKKQPSAITIPAAGDQPAKAGQQNGKEQLEITLTENGSRRVQVFQKATL